MTTEINLDEASVRQAIADRKRELRLLRSIERALTRHRREQATAETTRQRISGILASVADDQREVTRA